MKLAIVTGVCGQLGYYLVELLSLKGIKVVGVKRRTSRNDYKHLQKFIDGGNLTIEEGDVSDPFSVAHIMKKYAVLYDDITIFNTAAQSHVHTSFEQPKYTFDVNFGGVLNILEVMKDFPLTFKLIQCSTSEMFGDNYSVRESIFAEATVPFLPATDGIKISYEEPRGIRKDGIIFDEEACKNNPNKFQDEHTAFSPMSPYAVSKVAAHQLINNYRKAFGLNASCAIMFNYESPMRGDEFLTQKVCKYVWKVREAKLCGLNLPKKLQLGNLDSYRDFTFAGDTANAVLLMVQQEKPDDYVICSGETVQIREFVKRAFAYIGEDWERHVEINQSLVRPSEVDYLRGKADKAKKVLGWYRTMNLDTIIKTMVDKAYARV